MNKRTFLALVPALALFLSVPLFVPNFARAEGAAPAEAEKLLLRLIEAVKAESYDAFLADADANMKKQLSRQQFEGLCGLYTKPLKQGYTLSYFGQLKQRGMAVYVWKVAAAGAPDEALVRLWLKDGKDGKVSGVVVQ
jgi:hypothetical protein